MKMEYIELDQLMTHKEVDLKTIELIQKLEIIVKFHKVVGDVI
jgi:hypothetical protein